MGQHMLQRGSSSGVVGGGGCDELSVSVHSSSTAVVERPVEIDGYEVYVPQAVQQVVGLGKRKFERDLEKLEIRRLKLECDKMQKQNENMLKENDSMAVANRFASVNSLVNVMDVLNPDWRRTDPGLVLQATNYIKHGVFDESVVPYAHDADGQPSDSTPLGERLVAGASNESCDAGTP